MHRSHVKALYPPVLPFLWLPFHFLRSSTGHRRYRPIRSILLLFSSSLDNDLGIFLCSKGQRTLAECGVGSLVGILSQSPISTEEDDFNIAIQRRLGEWKDYWYDEYDWLSFDKDQARAFCKVCQAGGSKGVFVVQGSINIQKSSWDDHERSVEHKKCRLGSLVLRAQMDKAMATTRVQAEGSVMKLFYTTYWFGYFKKSCKRRQTLKNLQIEFIDLKKMLKRFIRVRWLSRAHAITRLYDNLESVMQLMYDANDDYGQGKKLFEKLFDFRILYILYFVVDILTSLNNLSQVFQHKLVDVSSIGGIVTVEVSAIRMLYLVDTIDINAFALSGVSGYHVLPEYGLEGGYMRRLSSELRDNLYHNIQIRRDLEGQDLEATIAFQKAYSHAIYEALLERFSNNDIIGSMKVLSTSQMPTSLTTLREIGVLLI
ncbi:hypothetical protein R1flu_026792 [Riccia fluitans]|uniref:C17orf113 probable zinc finger domain-containing protein n=1 Tax=Riccia fluitans TaxID=41844 RepID=A0ABD1XHK1_9MARC